MRVGGTVRRSTSSRRGSFPRDDRTHRRAVDRHDAIVFRIGSGCIDVQLVGLSIVSERYAAVFSSGAITPAVAPASIAMLQTVMRPSIESLLIADPCTRARSRCHP